MRSERLLGIVSTLQARGRCTAPALAQEFEVSVKTIQRDMEALSRAGVPVYASRGIGGGWELLPGYRSSLTGLTTAEALAIVIGRPRSLLAELGVDDPGDDAIAKLLGTLPAGDRERATRARQRLHVDPELWTFASEPEPFLPELYRAACDDLIVRLRYADRAARVEVHPLGLVFKRSAWYFVGRRDGQLRTYRVARVRELDVTRRQFDRPTDFDLARHWATSTTDYAAAVPSYRVDLRARGNAADRLAIVPVRRRTVGERAADGWVEAQLHFHDEPTALEGIRYLGPEVRIVGPDSLRQAAIADAKAFLHANGGARRRS